MIVEYICKVCNTKLTTDVGDVHTCLKCGSVLVKTFEKKWVGSVENGKDEVYINNIK